MILYFFSYLFKDKSILNFITLESKRKTKLYIRGIFIRQLVYLWVRCWRMGRCSSTQTAAVSISVQSFFSPLKRHTLQLIMLNQGNSTFSIEHCPEVFKHFFLNFVVLKNKCGTKRVTSLFIQQTWHEQKHFSKTKFLFHMVLILFITSERHLSTHKSQMVDEKMQRLLWSTDVIHVNNAPF